MNWEYFTHTVDVSGWFVSGEVDSQELNDTLCSIGMKGWELVSSFSTFNGGDSNYLVFIFKRPMPSA
jgi:hypothetical protein